MDRCNGNGPTVTDYARLLIRFKSWQLCMQGSVPWSERDEIEGDLWLAFAAGSKKFDPKRASLDTFYDRVINSAVRMTLRQRRRQKRNNGTGTMSLDQPPKGERVPLSRTLPDSQRTARLGIEPVDEIDRMEIAEAVQWALGAMPDELATVMRAVMGGTIASASRDLGKSRRQIRNALQDATPYFLRAGLN